MTDHIALAVRRLRRRPVFTILATLTLTIAIGAVSTTFSLLNATLLRPLPFPDPHQLVAIRSVPLSPEGTQIGTGVSHPNFLDLARETRALSAIAAYTVESPTLTADGAEPAVLTATPVTAGMSEVLRVRPSLGRSISADDDRPGAPAVAVLGHDLWTARFGSDPAAVGRTIVLDGLPHRVIGVLPEGFAFPRTAQLWTALGSLPGVVFRGQHGLQVVGRVAADAAAATARAELRQLMAGLAATFPRENGGRSLEVLDLHDALVGSADRPVRLLWFATLAVWLLACVNIAWLLLARAVAERPEISLRRAFGATNGQLATPWLHECVVIVSASVVAGALLAAWCSRWLAAVLRTADTVGAPTLDTRVLLATLVCAAATMLILTAIPTLVAMRTAALSAMRGTASGVARSRLGKTTTTGLIAGQVSGAVVLAWAAIVLLRSLERSTQVDLGFARGQLSVAALRLPPYGYQDESRIRAFYAATLADVRAIPGVTHAAVALAHPLQLGFNTQFRIAGDPVATESRARLRSVSDGYFRTAGVPVVAGREITADDRADGPRVTLVNEAFVKEFLAGRTAVGRQLVRRAFGSPEPLSYEIVGVVGDERFSGPTGSAEPALYLPFEQMPFASANLLVRAPGSEPRSLTRQVRAAVWRHERAVPLDAVRSMEEIADDFLATPRTVTGVIAAFAAVAGLLMMIGIHGILAQTVGQRRRDLAIRRALGATSGRIVGGVTRHAAAAVLVGLVAGAGLIWFADALIRPFVFEIVPADPGTILLTVLSLLLTAALGAAAPAWRAVRLSPATALRE